jgi:hypothetical protein
MSFKPIITDSEILKWKSQLRAMERKRDNIAITIAKILNFPNIWTVKMVDWNNPKVSHFKEEFQTLDHNINVLAGQIAEAEAINDGTIDYHNAKLKAYGFMHDNFHSLEEEAEFFAKNGLIRGMSSLAEAIYNNPRYLEDEVIL